jgi:hypothetical protein
VNLEEMCELLQLKVESGAEREELARLIYRKLGKRLQDTDLYEFYKNKDRHLVLHAHSFFRML